MTVIRVFLRSEWFCKSSMKKSLRDARVDHIKIESMAQQETFIDYINEFGHGRDLAPDYSLLNIQIYSYFQFNE